MLKYKTRLRELNIEVSEDEEADEDLTWPASRYKSEEDRSCIIFIDGKYTFKFYLSIEFFFLMKGHFFSMQE